MNHRLTLDRSVQVSHSVDRSMSVTTHTKKAVKGGDPPRQVKSYTCMSSVCEYEWSSDVVTHPTLDRITRPTEFKGVRLSPCEQGPECQTKRCPQHLVDRPLSSCFTVVESAYTLLVSSYHNANGKVDDRGNEQILSTCGKAILLQSIGVSKSLVFGWTWLKLE